MVDLKTVVVMPSHAISLQLQSTRTMSRATLSTAVELAVLQGALKYILTKAA